MNRESYSLRLPQEVVERIRQVAEDRNRPLESVIEDSIILIFGVERDLSPDDLDDLSDEQLWGVVYQRLAWPHDERLRELTALNQLGRLTQDEAREMEKLVAEVDRFVLLRSKALLLLKQRGHNVEEHLAS
jgi:hypothetical protein